MGAAHPLAITLLPGFPLNDSDYRPLLAALPTDLALTVAHSLGALTAVAEPRDGVTVLLAPSTPRRRPLRPAVRVALRAASATPWSDGIAERMRSSTITRYGADAPLGSALPLNQAAERLRRPPQVATPAGRMIVVCGEGDARRAAQRRFAAALGAEQFDAPGGHLFPITHPASTAALLMDALRG